MLPVYRIAAAGWVLRRNRRRVHCQRDAGSAAGEAQQCLSHVDAVHTPMQAVPRSSSTRSPACRHFGRQAVLGRSHVNRRGGGGAWPVSAGRRTGRHRDKSHRLRSSAEPDTVYSRYPAAAPGWGDCADRSSLATTMTSCRINCTHWLNGRNYHRGRYTCTDGCWSVKQDDRDGHWELCRLLKYSNAPGHNRVTQKLSDDSVPPTWGDNIEVYNGSLTEIGRASCRERV